jgi:hypothetical protein
VASPHGSRHHRTPEHTPQTWKDFLHRHLMRATKSDVMLRRYQRLIRPVWVLMGLALLTMIIFATSSFGLASHVGGPPPLIWGLGGGGVLTAGAAWKWWSYRKR